MSEYIVAALYKFVRLEDYEKIQPKLLAFCKSQNIIGTLLLGHEGINGTVAGSRDGIDALKNYLDSDERLNDTEYKESTAEEVPFYRMKVKLKNEIVTLGVPDVDPTCLVGRYIEPKDWNNLITQDDVILIDTRNDYEYEIGTFKNAMNPKTETFREFPEFVEKHLDKNKHKKVAMFCTGGIRCEKSTAYLLSLGFEEVFHLKGGILKYLEEIPEENSLWEGECFVFDNRVAVKHGLTQGSYDQCHGCRYPVSQAHKKSEYYVPGVMCHRCHDKRSFAQINSALEREKQISLAKKRGESHIGEKLSINQ